MRKLVVAYLFSGLVFVIGLGLLSSKLTQNSLEQIANASPTPSAVVPPSAPPSAAVSYASMPILDIVKDDSKLEGAIKELGMKKVIAKLVSESNGGSKFDCHQEDHNIGRVGYAIYKQKAFQECDASCHSGCYHGAMEEFLNEKGTENIAENIKSVCDLFDTGFGKFECLHGVGHGLLAYVDYDMLQTVNDCKKLDWFGTVSCYGGMFMENILTAQGLGASKKDTHITKWVSYTDAHFPCNALPADDNDLQFQCYQMQTSWMLTMFKNDFHKVAAECLKARADMIEVCFKSYGRDAAGSTLRNPEGISKICGYIDQKIYQNYYNQCVIGAVNVIVDFWGPELKSQAGGLCKILSEPSKGVCYSTVTERLSGLFKEADKKGVVCNSFEAPYKETCISKI